MDTATKNQGFSIRTTAIGAVIVLVAVLVWSVFRIPVSSVIVNAGNQTNGTTINAQNAAFNQASTTPVGVQVMNQLIASYSALIQSGSYSTSTAQSVAANLGSSLKPTVTYQIAQYSNIKTDTDTSYARMLVYRSALQAALKPLLANTQSEVGLFSLYTQTQDPTYLQQLKDASANYSLAASNTITITVPTDATSEHVGIVNAMREFAATLNLMIAQAQDPIGSAAALQVYTQAQNDVVSSFDAIGQYIARKNASAKK
ncbi:MAG: hypothetical protein JWO50_410 [Candidatus Kaiserbacteria bacterium]|nr:hypothetical protein [Candidatus Kaiserbacteria bacterium]